MSASIVNFSILFFRNYFQSSISNSERQTERRCVSDVPITSFTVRNKLLINYFVTVLLTADN